MHVPIMIVEKKPNPQYLLALTMARFPPETAKEVLQTYTARKKTAPGA